MATTSTSFISAGGLKKCMPTMRSGWGVSAAIAVTGSEEVLVARIASGPQASASSAKSRRFSSTSSGAASITRSQSASAATSSTVCSRPPAASASSALHSSRLTPLPSDSTIRSAPLSNASGTGSWSRAW